MELSLPHLELLEGSTSVLAAGLPTTAAAAAGELGFFIFLIDAQQCISHHNFYKRSAFCVEFWKVLPCLRQLLAHHYLDSGDVAALSLLRYSLLH